VVYGDIVRGLPVASKSCENVYSSHVLEHLCLDDFRTALQNTYRLLKPGGIFRFVLPDLGYSMDQYAAANPRDAALTFMKQTAQQTALGRESRARGLRGVFVAWLGNSSHLWMWDYGSIESELKRVGFSEVRRAYFDDSSASCFHDVETEERWDNCLGVECKRPFRDAVPTDERSRESELELVEGSSPRSVRLTTVLGRARASSHGALPRSKSRDSDTP